MNTLQQTMGVAFFVVFFTWVAASTVVVLANGGSLFSDDPECATFMMLTRKYSPPFWRKVTFWTVRLEIVLLVLFLLSFILWHENRVP